jgi:hypothetical protein
LEAPSFLVAEMVASVSPRDRILLQISQQRALWKYEYGGDWADKPMAEMLADFLAMQGIKSINDIAQFNQVMPYNDYGEIAYQTVNYFYNRKTGKQLTGTAQDITGDVEVTEAFYSQKYNDEWTFNFLVRFDKFGNAFFILLPVQKKKERSGWDLVKDLHSFNPKDNWRAVKEILAIMGPAAIIIAVVVSIFIPGIGVAIGSAIIGPAMAAAYPLVAQAVGAIVMNTVMNGGDVKQGIINGVLGTVAGPYGAAAINAVRADNSDAYQYFLISVAAGGVSSAVGQTAKIEFDSKVLGNVAESATKALLVGDSVEDAVTKSLIKSTGSAVNTIFKDGVSTPEVKKMDWGTGDYEYIDDSSVIPEDEWDFDLPDFDFDFSGIDFSGFLDDFGNYDLPDGVMPDYEAPDYGTIDIDSPDLASSFDMDDVWAGLSVLAQKGLDAYFRNKAIERATPKASNSASTRVNTNGTVTTTTATGVPITSKPGVGQPVVDAGGNTYINNGNGTYTVIRANGTTQTLPYTQSQTGNVSGGGFLDNIGTKEILIGAGLIGGALLLMNRNRR